MAYIDTKYLGKCETCRHLENGGCNTYCDHGEEYSPNLSKIPTADVVPQIEVERLQTEVDRLKKDNEYILMQHRFQRRPSGDCWNDVIQKAKTDFAREIFEEIEKILPSNLTVNGMFYRIHIKDALSELKKKYTEELK